MISNLKGFTSASSMQIASSNTLKLSEGFKLYLGGFIDAFERGFITLIEGDKSSLKNIHTELHEVMVTAFKNKWLIKLVDISNCFDPHLMSSMAFEHDVDAHAVLKNISLARPFQIYQSASIIKQLAMEITKSTKSALSKGYAKSQLILVTCIASQFLDPGLANEDPLFPIPQLELLRHSLGILQSLAIQGHTVIITELTELDSLTSLKIGKKTVNFRYQDASLGYASKIHMYLSQSKTERIIELKNHPYKPPNKIKIPFYSKKKFDKRQGTLNDWY